MSDVVTTLPGQDTLVGSWKALTDLSPGAAVMQLDPAVAAVFPSWAPLNNAILLTPPDSDPAAAVAQLEKVYAGAGVTSWALWLPSAATDLNADDVRRLPHPFRRDTTTLVMQAQLGRGMSLHDGVVRTSIATASRAGDDPVPAAQLGEPEGGAGLTGWVMVQEELAVAGAWSFLSGGDCGIYAVGTAMRWRRRGLARSLVAHVLAHAALRGARTATLQSTAMAQHLYESLGFVAAGRYEEWVLSSPGAG